MFFFFLIQECYSLLFVVCSVYIPKKIITLNYESLPRNLKWLTLKILGILLHCYLSWMCFMTVLQSELKRKKTHEVLFAKCIVCHCRSKNVLQNKLCGLETKQSPLNIIMEKLPEENTKKDIVVHLWLVCKKPVRDYRRGCWMV